MPKFRQSTNRRKGSRRRSESKQLEALEDRAMLAAFSVTADAEDGSVGSLRAAIIASNSNGEDDTIELAPGVYRLTTVGKDEDVAETGDLDITEADHSVVIQGSGAETTIIDASGLRDRAFDVFAQVNVTFDSITIQGGSGVGGGGAINSLTNFGPTPRDNGPSGGLIIRSSILRDNKSTYEGGAVNNWGPMTIENSQFLDNHAGYEGGGVEHNGGGEATIVGSSFTNNNSNYEGGGVSVGTWTVGTTSMTIRDSTIANNTSDYSGGGLDIEQARITVSNTTFSGNRSRYEGGAINNWRGRTELDHITVTGNSSSQGALNGIFDAKNSIFSGNSNSDVGQGFKSDGHNIISVLGNAQIRTNETDMYGVDPMLGPLADNGGGTLTHALLPESPAIDMATGDLPLDQRGFARGTDGDGDGIGRNDIGAVETPTLLVYTVNSERDAVDVNPGNGVVDTGVEGEVTLRAAIMESSAMNQHARILLPEGNFELTIGRFDQNNPDEDEGATNDLDVYGQVVIRGAGREVTTIDGGRRNGIFEVHESGLVKVEDITLRNSAGHGAIHNHGVLTVRNVILKENNGGWENTGGAVTNEGELVIENSLIQDNRSGSTGIGGGVANFGNLTVSQSTIHQNTSGARGIGGGIYHENGEATVVNSTISNNASGANGKGGGIAVVSGTMTVMSSTIYENTSTARGSGGGIEIIGGRLSLANSIVAQNQADQITGEYEDAGFNFVGFSDQPLLGPLTQNGGPTPTHMPLLGSPVIDQGFSFGLADDQRGFPRTFDDLRVEAPVLIPPHFEDSLDGDFFFPSYGDETDIGAVEATYELLAPLARDDAFRALGAFQSSLLTGQPQSVLENDVWTADLSAMLINSPLNGRLQLAEDGTFLYVPNAGFNGIDSFSYVATAGDAVSDPATVTIEIMPAASISGNSYLDLNDDGLRDATDIGLWQTRIELEGQDVLGNEVSRSMLTNTRGEYAFDDLVPGSYTIRKIQPTGLVDGKDTIGSLGGDDSVNNQFSIELAPGDRGEQYNFGEIWPAENGPLEVIGGQTIGDSNGDGLFESGDLIAVFRAGEYEDGVLGNSTFAEGDWNGDGEFDSADLIFAFQHGRYADAVETGDPLDVSLAQLAAAVDELFDDV